MGAESTAIYVIGSPRGPKKIGIAGDPRLRLSQLRVGSTKVVDLLFSVQVSKAIAPHAEILAHSALAERRIRGEWFSVGLAAAKAAITRGVVDAQSGLRGERTGTGMGQTRKNFEQMPARLPDGTFARMDAVLSPKEKRADFLRVAVEAELRKREKAAARQSPKPD